VTEVDVLRTIAARLADLGFLGLIVAIELGVIAAALSRRRR
jgi:hypothetical protein